MCVWRATCHNQGSDIPENISLLYSPSILRKRDLRPRDCAPSNILRAIMLTYTKFVFCSKTQNKNESVQISKNLLDTRHSCSIALWWTQNRYKNSSWDWKGKGNVFYVITAWSGHWRDRIHMPLSCWDLFTHSEELPIHVAMVSFGCLASSRSVSCATYEERKSKYQNLSGLEQQHCIISRLTCVFWCPYPWHN